MSSKTANTITTTIVVLLSLTLTSLTLPSAAHTGGCQGYKSVSDVLYHYDLPQGLFPNTVKDFKCDPVNKNDLRIKIQLEGVCKVTRELAKVGNVVTCQPEISGIISYRKITNIKGVTVTLTFRGNPVGDRMTVTEATTIRTLIGKFLEFNSDKGKSPWFPVFLIQEPPKCDRSTMSESESESESESDSAVGEVVSESNKEDITPVWIYKYGRLLPIVAA